MVRERWRVFQRDGAALVAHALASNKTINKCYVEKRANQILLSSVS